MENFDDSVARALDKQLEEKLDAKLDAFFTCIMGRVNEMIRGANGSENSGGNNEGAHGLNGKKMGDNQGKNHDFGFQDEADQIDYLMKKMRIDGMVEKMDKMQTYLRKQHGNDIFDLDSLNQYKDLQLPYKFKMPPMTLFDGTGDPSIHVKQYILAMRTKSLTKDQITMLFPRSLEGVVARWYHTLEYTVQSNWEELIKAFIQQYVYNTQLDITLRDLETTIQRPNESFSDFLMRWRSKAVKMLNRPVEKDQVRMVVKNLQSRYYEKMYASPISTFEQLYDTGLQVEDAIQSGMIDEFTDRDVQESAVDIGVNGWGNTNASNDTEGKDVNAI